MEFLIAIKPFDVDDEDAAVRKRRARENESQHGESARMRTSSIWKKATEVLLIKETEIARVQ